ncbi:MAG: hypothetical protein AAF298_11245 [Cyanobacteria bacterium P01_A01_bin.40]
MSIKLYTTTSDPASIQGIQTEDENILFTAGTEEAIAVSLKELFNEVINSVSSSIEAESTLTVEVSGSISYKAKGGASVGIFNIGGESGEANTMKVSLTTTIKP